MPIATATLGAYACLGHPACAAVGAAIGAGVGSYFGTKLSAAADGDVTTRYNSNTTNQSALRWAVFDALTVGVGAFASIGRLGSVNKSALCTGSKPLDNIVGAGARTSDDAVSASSRTFGDIARDKADQLRNRRAQTGAVNFGELRQIPSKVRDNAKTLYGNVFRRDRNSIPEPKPGSVGGATEGEKFPESVRCQALEENPDTCVYCRLETQTPQVDHAIPKARGGSATFENSQTTCPHCNASKRDRDFPVNPPRDYRGPWPPPWWKRQ